MRALPDRRWDLAAVAVVVAAVAVRVVYFARDDRVPHDPDDHVEPLPGAYWAIGRGEWGTLLWEAWTRHGRAWNLLLALTLRAFGRAPETIEAVQTLQYAIVVAAAAVVARSVGGSAAGFAAAALAAGLPQTVMFVPLLNVHGPECAALMVCAAAIAADRTLSRPATVVILGVAGAFAMRVRPSMIVPFAGIAAAVLLARDGERRPGRRIAAVAGLWSIGALPLLAELPGYVAWKSAGGPAFHGAWLVEQVRSSLGPSGLLVTGLGVLLAVAAALRDRARPDPIAAMVAWLAVSPLLTIARFGTGSTDFLHLAPALGVVAGVGLGRSGLLAGLGAVPLLLAAATTVWPDGWARRAWNPAGPIAVFDRTAPIDAWGARHLGGVLDAVCPPPGRWQTCHVLAPYGLVLPIQGDLGNVELLLLGRDEVQLRGLSDYPKPGGWRAWRVHLLVTWDCPPDHRRWWDRHPELYDQVPDVVEELGLAPAWSTEAGAGCAVHVLTPGGRVPRPERLPAPSGAPAPWTPEGWRAVGAAVDDGRYLKARGISYPSAFLNGRPPQGFEEPPELREALR